MFYGAQNICCGIYRLVLLQALSRIRCSCKGGIDQAWLVHVYLLVQVSHGIVTYNPCKSFILARKDDDRSVYSVDAFAAPATERAVALLVATDLTSSRREYKPVCPLVSTVIVKEVSAISNDSFANTNTDGLYTLGRWRKPKQITCENSQRCLK